MRRALFLSLAALLYAQSAGALAVWTFDLPATGLPSLNPPYATVATLTLTQTADGVQFTLDPNESSPGFAEQSFVERLDIAFAGSALTSASFRNDAGAPATFSFDTNTAMDAGYKADVFHIIVDFPSKNDDDRFSPPDTSTWTVLGAQESDFTGTSATASNKPSAIHAVISVTAYSLPDPKPTPSNWVTLTTVPEPTGALLLGLGLAAMLVARRQRS